MKLGLILWILISAHLSHARLSFTPVRGIIMEAPSCQELQKHAQSIAQWTQSMNKQSYNLPECFCSSKSCQMDVAPVSPYFVKQLSNFDGDYGLSSTFRGPNCFNAALVFANALPRIRFTHSLELSAVLKSPLCVERKPSEKIEPGDILVVRDIQDPFFEVHAATYISEGLSFSKLGEGSLSPYEYALDIEKGYGVQDEDCRRVYGTPAPGEKCYSQRYTNYFKCRSEVSFISQIVNQKDGLVEKARVIYAETSDFDSKLSGIVMKGNKVPSENLGQMQSELRVLYERASVVEQDSSLNKETQELVRLMRFRIFSLFEQIRWIGEATKNKSLQQPGLPAPAL